MYEYTTYESFVADITYSTADYILEVVPNIDGLFLEACIDTVFMAFGIQF